MQIEKFKESRATIGSTKKNFRQTKPYVHLTFDERKEFVHKIADCVSKWGFARLFTECVDKLHFDPQKSPLSVDGQAFEQVVYRFELYLQNMSSQGGSSSFGLIVNDNNETVARKHTNQMRKFHHEGTLWTEIKRVIETPMFGR